MCVYIIYIIGVFMYRHVYVYEYDFFMYVHMCTYCICMYVMTMYSAVRIPLVSDCAIQIRFFIITIIINQGFRRFSILLFGECE